MKKWLILALFIGVAGLYVGFGDDVGSLLSQFQQQVDDHPQWTAVIFFISYVLVTAFSLPFAALMTLMGGALFGFGWGLLLISFASSLGATLAFLLARTLLRDWVQQRFSSELKAINAGVEKQGAYYLFSLRLLPVVPFFVINLAFALTPMKAWTFYWVSQLGMLAGTAVYVNAGAQLGAVETLNVSGILTPGLLGAFVLLAVFPYILKSILGRLEQRRVYRPFTKPSHFDTNLVVIGAGAAGLVSAYIAAAVKARVTLIEREKMGGDCLNTGCVPSKALISAARTTKTIQQAHLLGFPEVSGVPDFASVMRKVDAAIKDIEPHDSVARYSELGVDCLVGDARIVSPWEVQIGEKIISARSIIIAAGASPKVPDIPGLEMIDYYTSETLWGIQAAPKKLLVMGGGPIGCELAQAFARLGSQVTLIGRADQLLPREDAPVAEIISHSLKADNVVVLTSTEIESFTVQGDDKLAHWRAISGETGEVVFDQLLIAVGREARTKQFSDLDLSVNANGTLAVNEFLQTRFPNIYACGDLVGPYQFTHAASHQAWYAAVNALFGAFKKFKVDYRVIPRVTYTSPEVASVGVSLSEAQDQGMAHEVTRYDLTDSDRAITEAQTTGFVQVITKEGTDKILGVTVVAEHAGEMLPEWVLAMKYGLGLNKILGTIHAYPTWNEANKAAAGVWKKNHAPATVLRWLERYHRWLRSS